MFQQQFSKNNALQQDTFIDSRFDKKPWLPVEPSRRARAGCKMGFRGVVSEYRADLPERCAAAKIKTQGGHYPCLWCMQPAGKLYDGISATSIASCPWVLQADAYILSAASAPIPIDISSLCTLSIASASTDSVESPHHCETTSSARTFMPTAADDTAADTSQKAQRLSGSEFQRHMDEIH